MTATTILGGNIDVDKFKFSVSDVQVKVIEPLLGSELYQKFQTDLQSPPLVEPYKTLFENYVQPITKFEAVADYVEIASFMITNGGAFKHAPANAETMSKDEIMLISQKYSSRAQMHIERFYKWICKNKSNIPEYRNSQEEVDPTKAMKLTAGLYLRKGKTLRTNPDTLEDEWI